MTSTDRLEDFRDFLLVPINDHAEKYRDHLEELSRRLSELFENILGETRRNIEEIEHNNGNIELFLSDMIKKISYMEATIFYKESGKLYYIDTNRGQKYLVDRNGDIHEIIAYQMRRTIRYVKKHFKSKRPAPSLKSDTKVPTPLKNDRRELKGDVYGFRIKNQNNLLGAWRLLRNRKNKYISLGTSNDVFERNFTGKKVTKKIIWEGTDKCLHYFIDGIYGRRGNYGLGVEKEDGGQWKKASYCFIKEDGSRFDSGNLSRTKNPPTRDMEKLNTIITQMNKQPKKKN
jgi:hypothetical protein